MSWSRLPSGTGYLRTRAWSDPDALDAALAELGASDRLIVDVRGNSGGGSGRPRTVALQRGVVLSVSTALTYEPDGRCVEGAGLAVGRVLPPDLLATGAAVGAADTGW
ncbi:hypothetical protein [Jiangella anatolica]|uniref:hypothetical protein n=1 Tax=Jiangella anatolica TaxID=2670374 RepID=UPI00131405B8|nr:hypothetical protein [Jiangella anatolica]